MDRDKLVALAERCEKAAADDQWALLRQAARLVIADDMIRAKVNRLTDAGGFMDAAMMLKPNGLGIYFRHSLGLTERPSAEVHLTRTVSAALGVNASYAGEQDFAEGIAPLPAMAMTAACLRALANGASNG